MYYCKSRFYVPKLRRWLNADNINYLEPDNINGLNLFMYCANDSVNKFDPEGNFAISLSVIAYYSALAAIAFVGVKICSDSVNSNINTDITDYKIKRMETIENVASNVCTTIKKGIEFFGKMSGNIRDSGLAGMSDKDIADALDEARATGDFIAIARLTREQKARGTRNVQKRKNRKRGGLFVLYLGKKVKDYIKEHSYIF